ncbi:MAG TPA: hypothetical protein PKZ95_00680 [Syntrophorhabdaceae bacterium]|jgi:TPP-dependent indolepyruvate ferredoxin oxidoreductase alpha subunit|nr:hypothetical protein [Syntrophorhabdaceae bacterium]
MHDNLCEALIGNGTRLIYTTNRSIGNTLGSLKDANASFHYEVSINEKVAYELALAGGILSKRTACIFSTEGLYEALDPLMSSAYTGVIGGFVLMCMKDTDEEVTPLGPFSKLPVIVSIYPDLLNKTIQYAYYISEKYQIPVIVQTETSEIQEAKDNDLSYGMRETGSGFSLFEKNPGRWAATPKFRFQLHQLINDKTEKIRKEFEGYEGNSKIIRGSKTGIITNKKEFLEFYSEDTNVLFLSTIYPLPLKLVDDFMQCVEDVYVIEGEYPVLQMQIPDMTKVKTEHLKEVPKTPKPEETMYGFEIIRDKLGAASSINMAHGIKKLEPKRKVLAITFEEHFFHSGMPAFVNTLYNNSSYVLLILTNEKEDEIRRIMDGFGFYNYHHINDTTDIESFINSDALTVLFYRGII